MNAELLFFLRQWYSEYIGVFLSNPQFASHPGLALKRDHTPRVCTEIISLSNDLALSPEEAQLAEVIALFHDIGRFEQYTRHGSYLDRTSVDHASLGVRILEERGVLDRLTSDERQRVLFAIEHHNKAGIPPCEDQSTRIMAQLIRDADKLDIWQQVTEYYRSSVADRNEALVVNLPDTPEVSDVLCNDVAAGRIGLIQEVKNLNDFKILQLGWAFDIYFAATARRVKQRRYLEQVRDALPALAKVDACFNAARAFIDRRATADDAVSIA